MKYDVQKTKLKVQKGYVCRFMFDRNHQAKDYGRAALSKSLEGIPVTHNVNRISIRYMPKNPVAKQFYANFKVMKVGLDRYGGVAAVLKL